MNFGRFFKNIYYLAKINLNKDHDKLKSTVSLLSLQDILDSFKYEIMPNLDKPIIRTDEECFFRIMNDKASICRFGDGELNLCEEVSIPFQKASLKLAERLREVLGSDTPNILITIPEIFYSDQTNVYPHTKNFARNWGKYFRNIIQKYIRQEKFYYGTGISQAYTQYINCDFKKYFDDFIHIWKDKDITIICGKTVFDKIEHNIFDFAKSVEYQYAPSINAFEEYDSILTQALTIDKNRLVIIILGPTATVLAYDMALQGYQALDLGHIAKSYDWYLKKDLCVEQTKANEFYAPD